MRAKSPYTKEEIKKAQEYLAKKFQQEADKDLTKAISRIKKEEEFIPDNTLRKEGLQNVLRQRAKENREEKKAYSKLIDLIEAGNDAGDPYFRLKYLDALGYDWNILILLGKKNIGKTYELKQLINATVKREEKVVYVRTKVKEAVTVLKQQFDEDDSDVMVKGRSMSHFELVHKRYEDEFGKPMYCGIIAAVSSFADYQGASYDNHTLIIWDECVSDGARVKVSESDLRAWDRFISSIVRNKKGVKIIMSGNLLEKVSDILGDPVLNYYGINPETNLKYIDGSKNAKYKSARILYVNLKDLCVGIEAQGTMGGVDELYNESLLSNEITPRGIKTVGMYYFLHAKPKWGLLYTYNSDLQCLYISSFIYSNPEMLLNDIDGNPLKYMEEYWIVHIERYNNKSNYGFQILTNESPLYNTFPGTFYVDNEDFAELWEGVNDMLIGRKVLYSNQETDREISRIIKHFQAFAERYRERYNKKGQRMNVT